MPNQNLYDFIEVLKRDFSAGTRKKMAAASSAMPGGRFPISKPEDVHNAMMLLHHASDQSAVKAHIRSRAKALGLGDPFQKSAYGADRALSSFVYKDWTG